MQPPANSMVPPPSVAAQQQQWMTQQPQYSVPPPQSGYYYQQPPPQQQQQQQPTSGDEVRTLWIGNLQFWMDETVPILLLCTNWRASYQSTGTQNEDDPNNTTIFVGNLDSNVTDDHLRQVFGNYGQLFHVKIPVGKRCGFVQFADRSCAEEALRALSGTQLSGQTIRLSWGCSPSNNLRVIRTSGVVAIMGIHQDMTPMVMPNLLRTQICTMQSMRGMEIMHNLHINSNKCRSSPTNLLVKGIAESFLTWKEH